LQDPINSAALNLAELAQFLRQQARLGQQDNLQDAAASKRSDRQETRLCYGLGGSDESLAALQDNLLQQIGGKVLSPEMSGQRWVCFGPSLQSLASQLAERGASSVWVDPLGRSANTQTASSFLNADLPQGCAGIILEGTINYPDQLHVLQRARAHLNEGGRLLLMSEYLLDDSDIAFSPLANLTSCRNLSARLGFVLQSEHDYSGGAKTTLDKLLKVLDSAAQEKAALIKAVEAIAEEYQSGRRSLQLFEWRWLPSDKDEYAAAEFADINSFPPVEIAELFQRSFNVEFNPDLWHWKYQRGGGKCVVARARPETPIVAHYGGAPRRIRYFGQDATAIQVCDVMVLPEIRRQYGRSSLFFRAAATFLEREIGNSVNHLLGFGFPNQKAMNIAKRLGLYEKTDEFVELILPPPESPWQVEPLAVPDNTDTIDRLWSTMRDDFSGSIIGVRDSDYLDYRYGEHPYGRDGLYQTVVLGGESPAAVAVLKKQAEHWLVMDLVAARKDLAQALRSLSAWGRDALQEDGLKFWITRGYLEELRCGGAIVNELGIEIPCNSWNRGPAAGDLAGKWWLTAGDMDFL